ncbi:alpha-1,2-fucosyltransferase [Candidatus Protochlamydia phocaeensis]|uniref:alpha-1,2-fucosyltransferase n=1 Tax=Candidatus Protochlamydia phocaeensis TaxID=1414722 RepID=UPI000838037A|nr:alpha-1,2-fucosyltransferase [Candidatus Protochlamydia phocaeensis]
MSYYKYRLACIGTWLLFPFLLLANSVEQPYVTCRLMGQLGNQLFQIATTLAYAWDHQARPIFPELDKSDYAQSYNRNRIFFRLDNSPLPRPFTQIFNGPIGYTPITYCPDHYLVGFFQSWKYFHHHRDKLLQVFAPSEIDCYYLLFKYGELLSHPNTVSVHVRTYDAPLHYGKMFPFVGLEYYKKALDLFPSDTLFVVFSDRINWCKHHFANFKDKNMIFIEGNDYIQDLFLMSLLKHHILANSTFSWWAAYLCQNPHQMVVAPSDWTHPDYVGAPNLDDLYFPHWIRIPYDYNAPYPADMQDYESKSLDNK